MTTPKQYAGLDNIVYDTDSVKLKNPVRTGKIVYENYPRNTGQQYKILYTVDTNDKYNSQGYEKNGFQGMVVAPVASGQPDYRHIRMTFANQLAKE